MRRHRIQDDENSGCPALQPMRHLCQLGAGPSAVSGKAMRNRNIRYGISFELEDLEELWCIVWGTGGLKIDPRSS